MAGHPGGVVSQIGGRIRLAFSRRSSGVGDELDTPPATPSAHEVEFVAYAEDCILSGHLRLSAERVSDLLNANQEFEMIDVFVEDLAGGHGIELHDMLVERDDLLLVHASGPRGNAARRHRTRQHLIVAKAGPYMVRGYIHALPGSDPIASLRHRKPMVALTDVTIEFTIGSVPQQRRAGVVILNQECVDWIAEGHDEAPATLDMPAETGGLLLKDFTGQLRD